MMRLGVEGVPRCRGDLPMSDLVVSVLALIVQLTMNQVRPRESQAHHEDETNRRQGGFPHQNHSQSITVLCSPRLSFQGGAGGWYRKKRQVLVKSEAGSRNSPVVHRQRTR